MTGLSRFTALVGLALAIPAQGAVYNYTPTAGGSDLWSAGTGWSATPVSAVDTELTFGDNAVVLADGLTNTNSDDIAGQFQLNILDLNGTGPNTGAGTVNINASGGATGLSMVSTAGPTTPIVNLNALAGTAGLTYNVNPTLTLSNNTLVTGDGTASFNFNGGISGATAVLTKSGTSTLTLGGSTILAGLTVGSSTPGGIVSVATGGNLSIGSGLAGQNVFIGYGPSSNNAYNGTLDTTNAASFTSNVVDFNVGYNVTGSPAVSSAGFLNLGQFSVLTATGNFRVGVSSNQPMTGQGGVLTTAAGGVTTIKTTNLLVGTGKSSGSVTLGANSTLNVSGVAAGARALLDVGNNTIGTSSSFTASFDASQGIFNGTLSRIVVGNNAINGNTTATFLIGTNALNHLDVSGAGNATLGVVTVGRSTAGTGVGTGTLTIGNLDATSQVVASGGTTAILIGQAAVAGKAVGTLNLNGGTLTINTSGSGIAGGALGTSTVHFNGTTLKAGTSSANWINNLTTADIASGGAIFDSNGFGITVPQNFSGVGALTKQGTGLLTLSGTNTYTGGTNVTGGFLFLAKTTALPSTGTLSVAATGGLGLYVGGAGEYSLTDLETFRTNGTFAAGNQSIGINTTNAGGDLTYTSSLNTTGNFYKAGVNKLTLGNQTTVAGSLTLGSDDQGGTLAVASGTPFSVGSGATDSLSIAVKKTSAVDISATLDASTASSFTANVGTIKVGVTNNSAGGATGTLSLPANNTITAATSFTIGDSTGTQNNVIPTVTTGAAGLTTIRTPIFIVGGSKSNAVFSPGAGSTVDLAGVSGGRSAFSVGNMSIGAGSGTYTATADLSQDTFTGNLSTLIVGNNNTGGSTSSISSTLTLSANAANHLDASATGTVVVVGRQQSSTATGIATGVLTIGNLDATSQIESTGNGTAILVGSASVAGKAVGTLNLNGGTLAIKTTGTAIGGTALGTSTVNFNGMTLKAGASSTTWITGLTNANVMLGGAKFDTNGFDVTVPQALVSGVAGDGGLTKSGSGTLVLAGANTYTGNTTVNGGVLQAATTSSLPNYATAGKVAVANGATLAVNIGGAGEFSTSDVDMLRTNGTFLGTQSIGIDTTNAPSGVTYTNNSSANFNLLKLGANTLFLNGTTNYTGNTTLRAGTVSLQTAEAIGTAGTVAFTGGTLQFTAANTTDYSGRFSTAAGQQVSVDTNGQNVTFASALTSAGGSLSKAGLGTLTLTGVNTFTGNTTVSEGSLNLAAGSGMTFAIGANGVNTQINGAGSVTLDGVFTFDLSGADLSDGNTWMIVSIGDLTFGADFSVAGYTQSGTVWTNPVNGAFFDESTGILTAVPEPGTLALVALSVGVLFSVRRFRASRQG